MIRLRVVPIGTSTSPVLLILPTSENILVPLLVSVPMLEYHAAPLAMICEILAQVSTLLIDVGLPHKPECTGNGGLALGNARLPSMDAMRDVSSPQTKAPAP